MTEYIQKWLILGVALSCTIAILFCIMAVLGLICGKIYNWIEDKNEEKTLNLFFVVIAKCLGYTHNGFNIIDESLWINKRGKRLQGDDIFLLGLIYSLILPCTLVWSVAFYPISIFLFILSLFIIILRQIRRMRKKRQGML